MKHIKNKHKDVIDETYERENTKEWLNKTLILSFKKQMKENYFNDEHKMTNQAEAGWRNQQSITH